MKKKFHDIKDILEIRYKKTRYIRTAELLFLQSLVKELPVGSRVLEIGSFIGKSAVCIAETLEPVQGKLDCVDSISEYWFPDQEKTLKENIRGYENISLIISKSENFFQKNTTNYDMIFLDGDHHIDPFIKDLFYSLKFCDKILCGHDFSIMSPWIIHALQSLCEDYQCSYTVTGYVWKLEHFQQLKELDEKTFIKYLQNKLRSNKLYSLNNQWYKNE